MVAENSYLLPDSTWYRFLYCTALNTLNLIVCLIGASMFAKTSVVILATVVFCLGTTIISFLTQKHLDVAIPEINTLVQNDTYHVFGNYTGLLSETLKNNLWPKYAMDYTTKSSGELVNFASVFGVLFSGVTGIMAGANMSGKKNFDISTFFNTFYFVRSTATATPITITIVTIFFIMLRSVIF